MSDSSAVWGALLEAAGLLKLRNQRDPRAACTRVRGQQPSSCGGSGLRCPAWAWVVGARPTAVPAGCEVRTSPRRAETEPADLPGSLGDRPRSGPAAGMRGVTKTSPKLIVHDWRLKRKGDTLPGRLAAPLRLVTASSWAGPQPPGPLASPNVRSRRNSGALRDGGRGELVRWAAGTGRAQNSRAVQGGTRLCSPAAATGPPWAPGRPANCPEPHCLYTCLFGATNNKRL